MDEGQPLGALHARRPQGQYVHSLRRPAPDSRPGNPGSRRQARLGRRGEAPGRGHLRRSRLRHGEEGGPGAGGPPTQDGGVRAGPAGTRRDGVHDPPPGPEAARAQVHKGLDPSSCVGTERNVARSHPLRPAAHFHTGPTQRSVRFFYIPMKIVADTDYDRRELRDGKGSDGSLRHSLRRLRPRERHRRRHSQEDEGVPAELRRLPVGAPGAGRRRGGLR